MLRIFFTAVVFVSGISIAQPRYQLTVLPPLDQSGCSAEAINSQGQIVGSCARSPSTHAFSYFQGKITDLTPKWYHSDARDLNDQGDIVGFARPNSFDPFLFHAYLFTPDGAFDLGTLGGRNSIAFALNNSQEVVGLADTVSGFYHAFLYNQGTMYDLGTLGGNESRAHDINGKGQIVGSAAINVQNTHHAFLFSEGVMIDLGTLNSSPYATSAANAINNKGQIVGYSDSDQGPQAFVYQDGIMTGLGSLGGFASHAFGINEQGEIVGIAELEPHNDHPEFRAFFYKDGKMYNLNDLVAPSNFTMEGASAINNKRQITGWGFNSDRRVLAFVLNPE